VFDGTGGEGYSADIAIRGERIVAIGDGSQVAAGRRLDLQGRHVAPGFIDIHTHSDISITYNPCQESALGMGVTTQVTGNCGLSMGLTLDKDVFTFERRWLAPHKSRIRWKSFAEHLALVEDLGVGTNYLSLVGHGSLRKRVMGMDSRLPTSQELALMQSELALALEAGAWGLSSGLEYPPAIAANEDELTELCRGVAERGGIYATHLRNEGDTLIEAVQEALNVAEWSGVALQLSHHKAEGRPNWGKVRTTLEMINSARDQGLDVQLDQYPYTAFMTSLAVQTLPTWALAGEMEETLERLTNPQTRAKILSEIRAKHPDWEEASADSYWTRVQMGVARGRAETQGQTIAELAKASGRNPLEFVLDVIVETDGFASAVNFAIGEEDIAMVLRHPLTSIGSDGVGTHPNIVTRAEKILPRAYGTFPRVLGRYVRDLGVISEAQAIHKMTGLPAGRLGLTERGRITTGYYADLTIYDPNTIADCATFDEPHHFATGIETVILNGRIAWEQGRSTAERAGKVLRYSS
jgi:N-acyl-D-amino-acid deacylase